MQLLQISKYYQESQFQYNIYIYYLTKPSNIYLESDYSFNIGTFYRLGSFLNLLVFIANKAQTKSFRQISINYSVVLVALIDKSRSLNVILKGYISIYQVSIYFLLDLFLLSYLRSLYSLLLTLRGSYSFPNKGLGSNTSSSLSNTSATQVTLILVGFVVGR